jgi:heme/copper-type cytochrome/quinol oxidase subunit 2
MNHHQSTARLRSKLFGIWIGLAIVPWGCSDSTGPGAQLPISDLSPETTQRDLEVPPIHEPYRIEITGNKDRWHVRYADREGLFGEPGEGPIARDVHVPLETDIVLVLKSNDFVYTLELPNFALKEIAVPKLEFRMEFRPPDAGRFPMLGDQLCGDAHPELQGDLIVEPRDHFLQWLNDHSTRGPSP